MAENKRKTLLRNNGAAYGADRFPPPYRTQIRPVGGRFMTTVEMETTLPYHVFLLHGGGYSAEALPRHADIVRTLARKGLRVTAFAYPLFPEHDVTEIHKVVYQAWKQLCEDYPRDRFAMFGDSAGGALALNLLMRLRQEKDPRRPMKTVLASPALDMSLSNPEIDQYKDGDISVNFYSAKLLGEYLAGERSTKDLFLSPLYGRFHDLGEILMYYGGKEFLRPDCELFVRKLEGCPGTTMEAHMAPERYHDYLMWVTYPESVEAFGQIAEFLKE